MGGNESILLFFHEISFHSVGPACASNFALKCRSETPPFLSPLELINQPTSWPISGGGRKADFVLIRSIVVTPVCVNAWRIFPFFFFFFDSIFILVSLCESVRFLRGLVSRYVDRGVSHKMQICDQLESIDFRSMVT